MDHTKISFNQVSTNQSHLVFCIADHRAMELKESVENFITGMKVDIDKLPKDVFKFDVALVMKHITEISNSVSELLYLTFEFGVLSSPEHQAFL